MNSLTNEPPGFTGTRFGKLLFGNVNPLTNEPTGITGIKTSKLPFG